MMRKNRQWHGGKGSRQRPTDRDKFNTNFDKIFKDRKAKEKQSANQELHS